MTAKVDILTAKDEDATTVPIQAVVKRRLDEDGKEVKGEDGEEHEVVYVIEDNKATIRQVTTGIADDLWVVVSDGLTAEDKVISGPYRTLKNLEEGDAVKPKKRQEKDNAKEEEGEAGDDSGGEVEVRID
jgi:HlyD family secretion protein